MNRTLSFFIILAMIGVMAVTGQAQAQPRVVITMADTLVGPVQEERSALRDEDGNLVLMPGDVVRYILTAANEGGEAAYNVEIVDPVPAGTEYVPGSAGGENTTITYSIDGGRTYVATPMIEVTNENGQVEKKPAPAEMYTHVKWLIAGPIEANQQVMAAFEVRVSEK